EQWAPLFIFVYFLKKHRYNTASCHGTVEAGPFGAARARRGDRRRRLCPLIPPPPRPMLNGNPQEPHAPRPEYLVALPRAGGLGGPPGSEGFSLRFDPGS